MLSLAGLGLAEFLVFTVRGDKTYLNRQEFLVKGVRSSNA